MPTDLSADPSAERTVGMEGERVNRRGKCPPCRIISPSEYSAWRVVDRGRMSYVPTKWWSQFRRHVGHLTSIYHPPCRRSSLPTGRQRGPSAWRLHTMITSTMQSPHSTILKMIL
eukprot:sb/3476696/